MPSEQDQPRAWSRGRHDRQGAPAKKLDCLLTPLARQAVTASGFGMAVPRCRWQLRCRQTSCMSPSLLPLRMAAAGCCGAGVEDGCPALGSVGEGLVREWCAAKVAASFAAGQAGWGWQGLDWKGAAGGVRRLVPGGRM